MAANVVGEYGKQIHSGMGVCLVIILCLFGADASSCAPIEDVHDQANLSQRDLAGINLS